MALEWESLPLLPLRCILDHLSVKEALAAMSTCRHWRQAMLLYEGHRDALVLRAKQLERSMFLARLFRKHAKKLHIYIDCGEQELEIFMNFVLPQFFDSVDIKEMVFIGSIYMQQNPLVPFSKLKRILTESLVYKHSNLMHKFAILGCEMAVKNDKDRYVHKQVEHYSKLLSFSSVTSPADVILSQFNVEMMKFSSLKHIVFEYELVTQPALESLSALKNLKQISLNVMNRRDMTFPRVNWARVNSKFPNGIDVAVNIINLPERLFPAVCENVFVEGLPLTSLKIMFCKTIFIPLISHMCCLYNNTLQELVWVDTPHDGPECARAVQSMDSELLLSDVYNEVNPFILVCWQCVNLRRLVIHGYWVWQYDILGFFRLRKNLAMEISSLYVDQGRFGSRAQGDESMMRVMKYDAPVRLDEKYIREFSSYSDREWKPFPWKRLPSGLRAKSSPESRATYIVTEVLQPLGVTFYNACQSLISDGILTVTYRVMNTIDQRAVNKSRL